MSPSRYFCAYSSPTLSSHSAVGCGGEGRGAAQHGELLVVVARLEVQHDSAVGAEVAHLRGVRLAEDQRPAVVPQEPDRHGVRVAVASDRSDPGDLLGLEARERPRMDVIGGVELEGHRADRHRVRLRLAADEPAQPVARLDEHVVGVALRVVHDRAVRAGVRPEEDDLRAEAAQAQQRVGHALVLDVPVGVDDEPVPAERVADRTRRQQREVDAARGELLEHLEQGAGVVVGQLGDERGLVGAGRRGRRDRAGDEHEPGDRVRVVADLLGEQVEVVMLEDAGRRDRGIRIARAVEQADRARDVARCRDVRVGGQRAR